MSESSNTRVIDLDVTRAIALIGVCLMNYYGYLVLRGSSRRDDVVGRLFDPWNGPFATRFAATFVTVAGMGIAAVSDEDVIALCRELLAANPRVVADVKGGKEQAAAGLIGQAKKKNPNVNPGKVRAICLDLIRAMP